MSFSNVAPARIVLDALLKLRAKILRLFAIKVSHMAVDRELQLWTES